MIFSKKVLLFSCLFLFSVVDAKKIKKTKKLQALVIPNDSSYFFALNAGNGIDHNPGAVRPQGAYYETTALIFPGDTVNKKQTDYSVDRHGNSINANDSIGMLYFLEIMLQTLDFNNAPPSGTMIEQAEWRFNFNHSCYGGNNIYANGFGAIKQFPPVAQKPIYKFHFGVTGASGCNKHGKCKSFKAKIYLPQSGSLVAALIEIKFDEEIEYKQ